MQDPAYKKVEPRKEINSEERDKFWAREEEQEKRRQMEEMKKKQDELLKLEQERLKREVFTTLLHSCLRFTNALFFTYRLFCK